MPTWALGVVLVLVHLVVTFLVGRHPRWNDGIFVLNDARDFPHVPLDHHALRIGNLLPVRGFLELFGYGQVAYYAWPFLTAILLVVAVFALGTVLFDRWTGAVATVLLIFHPVLVDTVIKAGTERMTSWQLLPDIPSTAFVTRGLRAADRRRPAPRDRRPAGRRRAATWWFLLAGFCFGWAYLVRELSVFFYPLLVGRAARLAAAAAPLGAGGAADARLPGARDGARPVGARRPAGPAQGRQRARQRAADTHHPHRRAAAVPADRRGLPADGGRAHDVRADGARGARRAPARRTCCCLAWFLVMWVPLTLVSGLLDPGFIRINASLMRYWVPVLPALVLGAVGFVSWLLAWCRRGCGTDRRSLGVAVTAAVAVARHGGGGGADPAQIARNPRDQAWNTMRAYLQAHDADIDTIITDDRDALVLGIYSRDAVGGGRVVHTRVTKVRPRAQGRPGLTRRSRHLPDLDARPVAKRPPKAFDGWQLLLKERELRLYGPGQG